MKKKVHMRSLRLYVNAGVEYPACCTGDKELNFVREYEISASIKNVTCQKCLARLALRGKKFGDC
jgi:hypothetical protein